MSLYKIKLNKERCILCHACEIHCQVQNRMPPSLRLNSITAQGPEADDEGRPRMKPKYQPCLHCKKPECVAACPTGALYIRESDALVLLKEELCDGCQACVSACPWSVPRMHPATGKMIKCDLCMERIDRGLDPACVAGCTGHALTFVRP